MTTASFSTKLRTAVAAIGDASTAMQSLCGRTTGTVVVGHSIALDSLPVTAVVVQNDLRIGGIGDRRRATLTLGAFADDDASAGTYGQDIAETIAALWRDLLTPAALEAYGLDCVLIENSDDIGDAFDVRDLPTQLGRAQVTCSIAATVLATV